MSHSDWIMQFPGLSRLPDDIRKYLTGQSKVIDIPADTIIFGPGKPPEQLLLLLSGTVRVQKTSEAGREIVLYRVHAGESCVLTTACLMAYEDYSAEGIAETGLRAVAIPREVFDRMVADSPEFRQFVFMAYSKRMTDLFAVVEEIAFRRLDIRLAQKLIELSSDQDSIQTTHQKLAVELGTAREVVSRQLSEFQRRGWIEQARGIIHILDREQITGLATQ
ncbi:MULTISPECIES: Crp/Fnr family transcriptional regulator [Thalassospira]|uniref:Crp/Fnr family transcriptional regulator n=2 Tax=Thalassospira TaxID=168934 RepID=A0A367W6M1_9PROT|nr:MULTISPECIES: Crp/Fnr family transcriptional regulator [Thalassospira]MDG4719160.1 Crp/Fnr family transcriptional regulator [Thalassospira sp. FZY0004]RCK37088.1 Crp/Fnr family transcriptional regulator [Thalassospira profundimaris]